MNVKKIVVLALAAAMTVSLAACDVDTDDSSSDVSTASTISNASNEKATAKVGETVTGDKWAISLLSAKTFKEIGTDFYTEKPEDGEIFLTLFFEVENVSKEDDYFNHLNFESYVDGYNDSNKILVNKPDGVDALTGDVAAGKKLKGHLTWEVSPDWKELEVSYKSDLWTGEKAATFVVTPDDLTA